MLYIFFDEKDACDATCSFTPFWSFSELGINTILEISDGDMEVACVHTSLLLRSKCGYRYGRVHLLCVQVFNKVGCSTWASHTPEPYPRTIPRTIPPQTVQKETWCCSTTTTTTSSSSTTTTATSTVRSCARTIPESCPNHTRTIPDARVARVRLVQLVVRRACKA